MEFGAEMGLWTDDWTGCFQKIGKAALPDISEMVFRGNGRRIGRKLIFKGLELACQEVDGWRLFGRYCCVNSVKMILCAFIL